MVKIYLQGNDITPKIIDWCIFNEENDKKKLTVTYLSGKKYTRPLSEWHVEPLIVLSNISWIYVKNNKSAYKVEKIKEVGEKYLFVKYLNNDKEYIYNTQDVEILETNDMLANDLFAYFRNTAEERIDNAKTEEQQIIVKNILNQFNKITPCDKTVLYAYLNKKNVMRSEKEFFIYPFGVNETQMKAISNAFSSQISIIQGPPGTGKTQTILNIIMNILIRGKKCAIVSNNNSAVRNIYEKLNGKKLQFLIAMLGNSSNIEDFFCSYDYQKKSVVDDYKSLEEIKTFIDKIKDHLVTKNELSKVTNEINEIEIEKKYLEQWRNEHPEIKIEYIQKYDLSSIKATELQAYLRILSDKRLLFKNKIDLLFNYRIFNNKFLNDLENRQSFIFSLQYTYYENLLKEKIKERDKLTGILKSVEFEENLHLLVEYSEDYLFQYLCENMPSDHPNFDKNNYKKDFADFLNYFPVIGSSTHSILNSIAQGYIFDYLIIDEASAQDIVPGILALSCTENIIIVGDLKQLSHIPVASDLVCPDDLYNCQKHNILESFCEIYKNSVPTIMLIEHYRCHPKIIQFCNKQFYDNQLIPMKKDNGENALELIITSLGNHMRKYANLREIQSYLEVNKDQLFFENNIGFIAPFNAQVDLAEKLLPANFVESTVHKFQGRECSEIVFSTVLDKKKMSDKFIDFVDDDALINVAVSRAINKFTLVTGDNIFTKNNRHIATLISYINYYANDNNVYNSPVVSAFDLLYSEFDKSLEKLNLKLNKNDSKYKSEQIVAAILRDILIEVEFKSIIFHKQVYLKQLVSVTYDLFTSEEKAFINNNSSCDFVMYNGSVKMPFAVIEVDGGYHNKPKQILRDKLKNSILEKANISLLRLPTIESNIEYKIREFLNNCLNNN